MTTTIRRNRACDWADSPESTCWVPFVDDEAPTQDELANFDPRHDLCDVCRREWAAWSESESVYLSKNGNLFRTRPASFAKDLPEGSLVVDSWQDTESPGWWPFGWVIDGKIKPWKSRSVDVDLLADAKEAIRGRR